jgi:large subunit ribosomal protein L17
VAIHQSGKKKLNLRDDHRRSLLRNQMASFIRNGFLQTTKARTKAVQRLIERLVTMVVKRNKELFNVMRLVRQAIPHDYVAVRKLVYEVAPRYVTRPGGYTRVLSLGTRLSDTAKIARLEWVVEQAVMADQHTAAPVLQVEAQ